MLWECGKAVSAAAATLRIERGALLDPVLVRVEVVARKANRLDVALSPLLLELSHLSELGSADGSPARRNHGEHAAICQGHA